MKFILSVLVVFKLIEAVQRRLSIIYQLRFVLLVTDSILDLFSEGNIAL